MATAIFVSFLTGITIVVSRTLNSGLAEGLSGVKSTFYNFFFGLVCAVALMLALGAKFQLPTVSQAGIWVYLGGGVGVAVVFLSNLVVAKISSFYMTLLLFIGQVFTGILLDWMITREFSLGNLLGGALVTIGMALNLWVDRGRQEQERRAEKE